MYRERDWIVPLAGFVVVEWLVAFALYRWIDYPSKPLYVAQIGMTAVFVFIMLACFFTFHFTRLARTLAPSPILTLLGLARTNVTRFVAIATGAIILSMHMITYSWAKSMLPFVIPFWADEALANLDEALFGTSAWRFAYALVGPASEAFRWAYVAWQAAHLFTLGYLLWFKPGPLKHRLILAYILTWVIGGVLAFLVSSAGPLFYGPLGLGDRFADMVTQPHFDTIPRVAEYLWLNYQQHNALPGGGISAFPSMHVAIAVWIALVVRHWSGWIFASLIFVGSFLLGWHYFLDAPAGVAVALAAYRLAPLFHRDALKRAIPTRAESAAAV